MNTKRLLHATVALLVAGAILSCSFVTQLFTGQGEKPPEQSTSSEEGQSEESNTGGEGESQESTGGGEGSSEPIVGTWKQIPFQGIGGKSNVFIGGSGVWFRDYFYIGTVNIGPGQAPPAQPGTAAGGVGAPPAVQQPASSETAAEIWRTHDGTHWEVVGEPGLGDPEYRTFQTVLYRDRLYVFAMKAGLLVSKDGETFETVDGEWSVNDVPAMLDPYKIGDSLFVTLSDVQRGLRAWLSTDGERFDGVGQEAFGQPGNQATCGYLTAVPWDDWYYLGIENRSNGGGVWRTKDGRIWEDALKAGLDIPTHILFCTGLVHNGYVYETAPGDVQSGSGRGVDVIRTADGKEWETVIENGFGLGEHQGYGGWFGLYRDAIYFVLLTGPENAGSAPIGFRLWKSSDGKAWQQVGEQGFGDPDNGDATLIPIRDVFYLVTRNLKGGNQIWRSTDGTSWEKFFTFPPDQTNYGHGLLEIADGLEYFEYDMAEGVQIWRYGP